MKPLQLYAFDLAEFETNTDHDPNERLMFRCYTMMEDYGISLVEAFSWDAVGFPGVKILTVEEQFIPTTVFEQYLKSNMIGIHTTKILMDIFQENQDRPVADDLRDRYAKAIRTKRPAWINHDQP